MEDFAGLVRAARDGDRAARERLLENYLPQIRAYVRLRSGPLLRQRESHSDLVQTVCRQLLQDLGDYRGEGGEASFKAWLFTMALRKLAERGRFHGAERRDPAREVPAATDAGASPLLDCYASFCTPSRVAIAREEIARIEAGFDALSDEHREVITLACVVGLPHREIAHELGKTEEAVRKLLSRARARLAMLLV